jgi:membrane-bound lytic murein transglycosylase D
MISLIKIINCLFLILVSNVIFASSIIIDFELPDFKLSYPIPQTIEPSKDDALSHETGISNENHESQKEPDQLYELNDLEEDTTNIKAEPIIPADEQKTEIVDEVNRPKETEKLIDSSNLFIHDDKFDIDFFSDTFFNPQLNLSTLICPSPEKPQSFFSFLGPVYKNTFSVPDIPIYTNKKINGLIRLYTKRKIKVLKRAIERSSKYIGMMQRIFHDYRLPKNLVYLSIVESNLNPTARSRANALGIWQFMRHTGRVFDLNQSWWHEDRYDPVKSTHAAAKYLTSLHRQFSGDWELALAAYNSGAGRVRGAQKKARRLKKSIQYWNLDLPKETRGYVPAFYAVANLFSDLNKYGFEPAAPFVKEQKTQSLTVPGGVSLSEIAGILEIKHPDFKEMNPGLIKGMTPATLATYAINIPAKINIKSEQLEKIDLLKKFRQKFWKHHKVRKGDTLWAISRKYGIPISKIKAFNQFRRNNLLRIGQKIMLPVPNEWKSNRVARPSKASFKKTKDTLDKIPGVTYVHEVEKGDTLWKIAQRFKVSIQSIKSWNRHNLSSRILKIGTKLFIKMPVNIAKSISSIKL